MKKPVSTLPACLLTWTFRRGHQTLTCALRRGPTGDYAVSVESPSTGRTTIVGRSTSSVAAFQQHAAIVLRLRQHGWTVVAYAPPASPRTPAPQRYPLAA